MQLLAHYGLLLVFCGSAMFMDELAARAYPPLPVLSGRAPVAFSLAGLAAVWSFALLGKSEGRPSLIARPVAAALCGYAVLLNLRIGASALCVLVPMLTANWSRELVAIGFWTWLGGRILGRRLNLELILFRILVPIGAIAMTGYYLHLQAGLLTLSGFWSLARLFLILAFCWLLVAFEGRVYVLLAALAMFVLANSNDYARGPRDFLLLAVGLLVGLFFIWVCRARCWRAPGPVVLMFFVWALVSTGDSLWEGVPILEKTRVRPSGEKRVAIAFSGGGYRAAVYHAGVLYGLERQSVVKFRMSAFSSVSGGSIFAAYYAAGGTPIAFRDAVVARRFNIKRELLNLQNAARLLLFSKFPGTNLQVVPGLFFSRLDVQAELLDRLFLENLTKGASRLDRYFHEPLTLGGMANQSGMGVMLCSTDLIHGRAIGISALGTLAVRLRSTTERADVANPVREVMPFSEREAVQACDPEGAPVLRDERVSILVAASGAFPGVFNPLMVVRNLRTGRHSLKSVVGNDECAEYLLADGGLGDNLGLGLLREATARAAEPSSGRNSPFRDFRTDVILVSDGSALMSRRVPQGVLAELGRAADVTYLATGEQAFASTPGHGVEPTCTVLLSPQTLRPVVSIDRQWLRLFGETPTLDDTIDAEHANAIFQLGSYLAARSLPHVQRALQRCVSGRIDAGPPRSSW